MIFAIVGRPAGELIMVWSVEIDSCFALGERERKQWEMKQISN